MYSIHYQHVNGVCIMTVAQLIDKLSELPDDCLVVFPADLQPTVVPVTNIHVGKCKQRSSNVVEFYYVASAKKIKELDDAVLLY